MWQEEGLVDTCHFVSDVSIEVMVSDDKLLSSLHISDFQL